MAVTFLDRVKVAVAAAPGTGDIQLGNALAGFVSFAAAGAADGATISYVIEDGTSWEVGRGTFVAAGPTLKRSSILRSSLGATTAINASTSALVYSTLLAEDIADIYAAIKNSGGGSSAPAAPSTYSIYRMTLTQGSGNSAFSFAEIALTDLNGATQRPTSAAASTSYSGNGQANGIDNDPSTVWANSGDANPTYTITYPTAFALGSVRIQARSGDYYTQTPQTFTIDGSNDGTTFTNVGTGQMAGAYTYGGQEQTYAVSGFPTHNTKIVQMSANAQSNAALPNTPTNGNLLVAFVAHTSNSPTLQSGWTQLDSFNGYNDGGFIAYKTVSGDNQYPVPCDKINNIVVFEISGAGGNPSLIVDKEGTTGANVTHLDSGSFTPGAAALALFAASRSSGTDIPTFDTPLAADKTNTNGGRSITGAHAYLAAGTAVTLGADWPTNQPSNIFAVTIPTT